MKIEEFENIFGNVPFDELKKINKYIADNYIEKSKVKEAIDNGISDAKGWGCEEGAYRVKKEFERMGILEERN